MMMGTGMFGGMFIFWIVIIGLGILLVRGLFQSKRVEDGGPSGEHQLTAREILEQRYARGEINQEQYRLMLKDILES